MVSFEALLMFGLVVAAVVGGLALYVALRQSRSSPATRALGEGDFATVLDVAELGPDAHRDELYSAAVAAKHLLELDLCEELLRRMLDEDPQDGEAWLELGLLAAYSGRYDEAEAAFVRVQDRRMDLLESLTLHRAWVALQRGDGHRARSLFEEVEAPLETKLRTDLGEGEPLFVEWFLQAASLWQARGDTQRAAWAREMAAQTAPSSRLQEIVASDRS